MVVVVKAVVVVVLAPGSVVVTTVVVVVLLAPGSVVVTTVVVVVADGGQNDRSWQPRHTTHAGCPGMTSEPEHP